VWEGRGRRRMREGRKEGRRGVGGYVLMCVGTRRKETREEKREGVRENCALQEGKKYRK
jgi:hypothetical protein